MASQLSDPAKLCLFVLLDHVLWIKGRSTQIHLASSRTDHSADCRRCVINWLDKFIEWPAVYGGNRRNRQRASERGKESETETYLELRMSRRRCLSAMVTVSIVQCLCIHGVNNQAKQKDPNTSKALGLHSSLLSVRASWNKKLCSYCMWDTITWHSFVHLMFNRLVSFIEFDCLSAVLKLDSHFVSM